MEGMSQFPDNYFDLAIVDPEYGLGSGKPSKKPNKCVQKNGSVLNVKSPTYKHKDWDNSPAGKEYFDELMRISKNQIIWGVNYYDYKLTGGRIVWGKMNGKSDQYDCEIAYNSMDNRTDIVYYMWSGMFQGLVVSRVFAEASRQIGNKKLNEKRIHPTQKPVKLYKWLLEQYAQTNFKMIDTHAGSCSSVISFLDFGCDWVAFEIDKDYYTDARNRIENHRAQSQITFAQKANS